MARKTRHCQRCKVMIPASRCEVFPETRVCVKCSEAIGGEFIYEAVTRGVSKGGIKITGTEVVEIRQRRKVIQPLE
jgi:hypothetical protein